MVNKKARNKDQELDFDLPPTKLAKTANLSTTKERKRKSKPGAKRWEDEDDTPKAFARMMSGGSKRSGLDEGGDKKRKRKPEEEKKTTRSDLKIQPGESLREFGRRVDQAIPVVFPRGNGSAREKKKKKTKEVVKEDEDDSNLEPEEGEEINSDDDDEEKDMLRQAREGFEAAKRKRGKRRGDSPDPWADLEKKREQIKFGDVAAAPPTLKKPRALLYLGGKAAAAVDVDGVPKSAGSLAKREELAGQRRNIIEEYRKMMAEKRAKEAL
ncbi:hypothetical protein BZA05DRAFT_432119 [Tricharina praecox]|uniref:uncharacterized protein n=1 Tax=Tricharina praecox TaxID=43433 RepID=UPI00221E634A|nr:uncharacterized protein BZA05DRAFT_432119 [Tricharina praecox]KAI5841999.1 hypothetical protein BZA05DRAFT_432119 [Tricharina praecox]